MWPNCAGMSIGSLPHTNPAEACEHTIKSTPEVVALPLLPNTSFKETICIYTCEKLPGLVIDEANLKVYLDDDLFHEQTEEFYNQYLAGNLDYFSFTGEYTRGYSAMIDILENRNLKGIRYLKGNVSGPVTVGFTVKDRQNRPIFYNRLYRDCMIKNLNMKARWLENRFSGLNPKATTLIMFSEPILGVIGSSFYSLQKEEVIESINACLEGLNGLTGIHCCNNTDWEMLLSTKIKYISFDAYHFMETFALFSDKIHEFLDGGGMIAWGIIPTEQNKLSTEASEIADWFLNCIKTLSDRGIPKKLLLERSFITPVCGTGSLSVEAAERIYSLINPVCTIVRQKEKIF